MKITSKLLSGQLAAVILTYSHTRHTQFSLFSFCRTRQIYSCLRVVLNICAAERQASAQGHYNMLY